MKWQIELHRWMFLCWRIGMIGKKGKVKWCTLDETQEWATYNGAWVGAYENGLESII